MAQHELTYKQGIVLEYFQKVKKTYEKDHNIGKRLNISGSGTYKIIVKLIHFGLISKKDDEGQRLLEITKLGSKHLVILEELGQRTLDTSFEILKNGEPIFSGTIKECCEKLNLSRKTVEDMSVTERERRDGISVRKVFN